jgi:hypothetical protein
MTSNGPLGATSATELPGCCPDYSNAVLWLAGAVAFAGAAIAIAQIATAHPKKHKQLNK